LGFVVGNRGIEGAYPVDPFLKLGSSYHCSADGGGGIFSKARPVKSAIGRALAAIAAGGEEAFSLER